MNLFFDTSVLVAASSATHMYHMQALAALQSLREGVDRGWISQHTLAETYAVLTVAPLKPRIHPSEALCIIENNILPNIAIIPLEPDDYREAVRYMDLYV